MAFGEWFADEVTLRISSPSTSVRTARSGSFGVDCRPADIRTRHSNLSVVAKRGRSAASASRSRSDTQVSIVAVHTCVGDGYTPVNLECE